MPNQEQAIDHPHRFLTAPPPILPDVHETRINTKDAEKFIRTVWELRNKGLSWRKLARHFGATMQGVRERYVRLTIPEARHTLLDRASKVNKGRHERQRERMKAYYARPGYSFYRELRASAREDAKRENLTTYEAYTRKGVENWQAFQSNYALEIARLDGR